MSTIQPGQRWHEKAGPDIIEISSHAFNLSNRWTVVYEQNGRRSLLSEAEIVDGYELTSED